MNTQKHRIHGAFAVALGVCTACTAFAGIAMADPLSVTVGDPANPGALSQAIQDAYKAGARHIAIAPGDYTLPVVDNGPNFDLNGWRDVVVSAYGVSLMIDNLDYGHRCFQLTNCEGVTVEGPTISQVSMSVYQGRILSTGAADNGNETCVWKPDAGYPIFPADAKNFTYPCEEVDQHTRQLKRGLEGFNTPPITNLGDGTFRIDLGRPHAGVVVGDWLCGRGPGRDSFKVYLETCRNCTVKDVTMYRNGFSAIRESSGGGNHIIACHWAPGPPPDGGTEPPLFCAAADGFHSTLTNPGPDIENCTMDGLLDDDCIAIHGNFQDIQSVSGSNFTISNHNNYSGLAAGQPARIDNETFFVEATVTAMHDNGDGTTTVSLDKDYHIPPGTAAFNPLACGPGYKIINCRIGNTRARGIIAKADNGIIRGNTVIECGISAMQLGSDWFKGEAGYSNHVLVENNIILGNAGQTNGGMAAIHIGTEGTMENKDWIVRNNKIDGFTGPGMSFTGTDGALVEGNKFTHQILASPDRNSIVAINHSANIVFKHNTVVGWDATAAGAPLSNVDATSTNIVGLDSGGLAAK